jgi:hypothetical protein
MKSLSKRQCAKNDDYFWTKKDCPGKQNSCCKEREIKNKSVGFYDWGIKDGKLFTTYKKEMFFFKPIQKIGAGSFGVIYLFKREDEKFPIEFVSFKDFNEAQEFKMEAKVLSKIKPVCKCSQNSSLVGLSSNIVCGKIVEGSHNIVMDYISHGILNLRKLSIPNAKNCIIILVKTILCLNTANLTYTDFNNNNFMCKFIKGDICNLTLVDYGGMVSTQKEEGWFVATFPPCDDFSGSIPIGPNGINIFEISLELLYNIIIVLLVCSFQPENVTFLESGGVVSFTHKSSNIPLRFSSKPIEINIPKRIEAFKSLDHGLFKILGEYINTEITPGEQGISKKVYTETLEKVLEHFLKLK